MQNAKAETTPTQRSTAWRIISWFPVGTLLLAAIILLVMMLLGGMIRIAAWYLFQFLLPLLGLLFLVVTVLSALFRRRLSRTIVITGVASLLALLPGLLMFSPVAYPASLETTTPAATVRLPADVPLKVAWGGDNIENNYHSAVPDQRWAYDLIVEPYLLENAELEDYGCYGVPVFAPADALVIAAQDGEPDATPGEISNNIEAPLGNFVALQLPETGTYLIIAHMKPGSVLVEAGDTVEEGQQIGQCGNSGNTSEPHIHIHHQRQDPTLFPVNFAEGLPLYFRDHDGEPMPTGGVRLEGEEIFAEGAVVQHIGSPGR